MAYKRFEELPVWQKAKNLAVRIYRVTQEGKLAKCYSFGRTNQEIRGFHFQ